MQCCGFGSCLRVTCRNFFFYLLLLANWRLMTKITGSGSIRQRHGSPDPESGSTPKCHGSAKLIIGPFFLVGQQIFSVLFRCCCWIRDDITIYWPMIPMCPCIIDFIGGNGLRGRVGGRGPWTHASAIWAHTVVCVGQHHRATIQAPLPSAGKFFFKATDVSASP